MSIADDVVVVTNHPFMWTPDESDRAAAFRSLLHHDGYHCPWPECDYKSPAPQGIARHMDHTHGWKSPWAYQHSKVKPKTRVVKKHPSDTARKEQVTCPVDGCDRTMRQDYVRHHLKDFHRFNGTKVKAIMETMGLPEVKARRGRVPKKPEVAPLAAVDVCRMVLAEAAPGGVIPVAALDAYQDWVDATQKFFAVLYT